MAAMDNQHVAGFHQALTGWTDHRFVSRDELEALAMFDMYLVNLLEARGRSYYGHTYSQKGRMGCLVVKANWGEIPQVVFTNGRTYVACIRIFLRRLQEDAQDWRLDKYRG